MTLMIIMTLIANDNNDINNDNDTNGTNNDNDMKW